MTKKWADLKCRRKKNLEIFFFIFCDKKMGRFEERNIENCKIVYFYFFVTMKWADLLCWRKKIFKYFSLIFCHKKMGNGRITEIAKYFIFFLWQESGQIWNKDYRKLQNILFSLLWQKSGQIWSVKEKDSGIFDFIFCDKKMGRFEEKNIKNWKYSVLFFVTKKWADLKLWDNIFDFLWQKNGQIWRK